MATIKPKRFKKQLAFARLGAPSDEIGTGRCMAPGCQLVARDIAHTWDDGAAHRRWLAEQHMTVETYCVEYSADAKRFGLVAACAHHNQQEPNALEAIRPPWSDRPWSRRIAESDPERLRTALQERWPLWWHDMFKDMLAEQIAGLDLELALADSVEIVRVHMLKIFDALVPPGHHDSLLARDLVTASSDLFRIYRRILSLADRVNDDVRTKQHREAGF